MLNALLKRLNGHALEPGELDAALLQLGRDRGAALAARAELEERRKQALLDDESAAAIRKIDNEIEAANILLEKLNVSETPLRERLTQAQAEARRQRWKSTRAAGLAAAAEFIAQARAATELHAKYVALRERAVFEFGEAAAALPPTPNLQGNALLAPDLLDLFERACSTPAADPPTRPTKTPVKPRAPAPSIRHGVRLGDGAAPIQKAPRAADDAAPLAAGEVRVRALRAGFSPSDDQPQVASEQIFRMNAAGAHRAAAAGAVEILEERTEG